MRHQPYPSSGPSGWPGRQSDVTPAETSPSAVSLATTACRLEYLKALPSLIQAAQLRVLKLEAHYLQQVHEEERLRAEVYLRLFQPDRGHNHTLNHVKINTQVVERQRQVEQARYELELSRAEVTYREREFQVLLALTESSD